MGGSITVRRVMGRPLEPFKRRAATGLRSPFLTCSLLLEARRDLYPAFWVSMTGTDNFIQKTDPRKPLGYHITYKFTADVFSYPLPSPHEMYANLNVMYENVLFRCTSLGSFDIAAKRVNKFEI